MSECVSREYDDLELLTRARRNLEACADWLANDGACLGRRWQAFMQRIRSAIGRFSSVAEAVRFAQMSVGFEHRGNIAHEGKFTALYESQLAAEFPALAAHVDSFGDSPLSDPTTVYEHKGRLVSNVLFWQARYVLVCLTYLPRPPRRILEIGGGYGGPARHWLRNPIAAPQTYIIVDIPEALFFADLFLCAHFGEDRVYYVPSTDPLAEDALKTSQVVLCPLMRKQALKHLQIDLVVNTGSLQEMTEDWVDHYMSWLDLQPCHFFYSLNYFAQRLDFIAEGLNLWAPRLSPQWEQRLQPYNPHWIRLQTERNYAEIIGEKTGNGALSGDEAKRRADLILEERFLDGAALLELLDLYRRSKDPSLA